MENKQDKWEKLINITEEYDVNNYIPTQAISQINKRKRNKRFSLKWISVVASCVVLIGITVLLPVYYSSRNTVIYYTSDKVEVTDVEDINTFIKENNMDCLYFSEGTVNSRVAKLVDTGEIAYLIQNGYFIDENGIDAVNLYIMVMQNAQFDFCRDFEDATETMEVSGIEVFYSDATFTETNKCIARFSYLNSEYFMTISTFNDSTDMIMHYVNLLTNQQ